MKKSIAVTILILIFLVTLTSRLFLAFQTPYISYDSYDSLRQIENINEEGVPLFNDELSYGGRSHLFPPIFYYLVSFFDIFGSDFAIKVIPNLLFALIVIPIYLISFNITKDHLISLMTSFFSGFIPIFFSSVNSLSSYSLVAVLTLFVIYSLLNLNKKKHLNLSLILIVVFVFTHSSVFLVLIGLLLYLLMLKVESLETMAKEQEIILFASFLALWFNFIVFKTAFAIHGPLVIWQNIPLQILTTYFFDLNIFQSLYFLGLVPVFFGIYTIYSVMFTSKKKSLILIISLSLSVLILLWAKLLAFKVGLLFLGLFLVILSSHSIKNAYSYIKKTKVPSLANWFLAAVFLLFLVSAIIPSIYVASNSLDDVPSQSEIDAMLWIKDNTPVNSTVLARVQEGHLITFFAERKNVIDDDFLMVEDAQTRYDQVQDIFSLRLKNEVVRRLTRYNVNYIYFSGLFGSEENLYYVNDDCFNLVYDKSIKIYELTCSLR